MNSSNKTTTGGGPSGPGPRADRRRRKRVKMAAPIRVRTYGITNDCFEEICTTVDASRDGVLFTSLRRSYRPGQQLAVAFPYTPGPAAINAEQKAEVVRVTDLPGGHRAVALHLLGAIPVNAAKDAAARTSPGDAQAAPRARGPIRSRVAETAQQTPTAQPAAARPAILAVGLEPHLHSALSTSLPPQGYDVPTASIAEAQEFLGRTTPALVVIEVAENSVSGYELCRHIKGTPLLCNIPIILITGDNDPTAYADVSGGAVMCLARPVEPERLLRVVRLLAPPPARGSAYSESHTRGAAIEHNL
jgi:CheY-like chemotaxis protein